MNTAIAIVNIGDQCRKMWTNIFAPSVRSYADRHDYTVCEITESMALPGDTKHPAWQKLLVASRADMQQYDRIVFLDSDVMCNPGAPAIAELVPDHKIGAVTWQGSYNNDPMWYDWFRWAWSHNESDLYREADIKSFSDLAVFGGYPANEDWLNSGVLVFGPEHAGFLSDIYYNEPHSDRSANEQQALTHYLCHKHPDMLHPLDRRFNAIWYMLRSLVYPFINELHQDSFISSRCVEVSLLNNYFLHFAADKERKQAVNFMKHAHLLEQEVVKR